MSNIGNIPISAYNARWTPETTASAAWPKATAGYTRTWLVSNRYVENGSYLKMKYITLSYNWQKPIKGIEKIGFALTANNSSPLPIIPGSILMSTLVDRMPPVLVLTAIVTPRLVVSHLV